MEKDIISLIFEKKEDDELFYSNCEEKNKCEDSKKRISEELFDFIEILFLFSMVYVFQYGYEIQRDSKGIMYDNEAAK